MQDVIFILGLFLLLIGVTMFLKCYQMKHKEGIYLFIPKSMIDKSAYLKMVLVALFTISVIRLLPITHLYIETNVFSIIIKSILTLSIVLSLLFPPKKKEVDSAKTGIN